MTTYIKGVSALALILASSLALAASAVATPAFADYGAPAPVYNDLSQVCTSRYDPNCIVKETNAAIYTAAPYQQYQAPSTNYNYGNSYNNNNYSQPNRYVPNYSYSYNTPNYNYNSYSYSPYSNYSYNNSYNYQYQYQWSYNATPSCNYNSYSYSYYYGC